MNDTLLVEDFLEHYGVKGMRWGVRKDEAQSLAKDKAKQEKKAIKREAEAKEYDAQAKSYQQRIDTLKRSKQPGIDQDVKWLELKRDNAIANAEETRNSTGLTPRQKKLIKGAAIAGGVVVAFGAYKMVQSGSMNQKIMKGRAFIEGRESILKRNDLYASSNFSIDELHRTVVSGINPDYGRLGSKMNCRRCTFAYELRRRGFNVAATRTSTGFGQNAVGLYNVLDLEGSNKPTGLAGSIGSIVSEQIKDKRARAKYEPSSTPITNLSKNFGPGARHAVSPTGIFERLKKMPDGARGELGVSWNALAGHSMVWEIVKGKPVIFDTQTGQKYTEDSSEWYDIVPKIQKAGITRLDNVPLDMDFLLRWVKDG